MTPNTDFTEAQRKALDLVEKLMRLAGKNTNEAEASAATEKAMKILEEHNLSLDAVDTEGSQDRSGKRAQESLAGGFYQWERDLWTAVAHLNFCWYWTSWRWEEYRKTTGKGTFYECTRTKERKRWEHVLVGRVVNVKATQIMAQYLVQVAQRLTKERLHGDNTQMLSAWAVSFREGIIDRVCDKLNARRERILDDERSKARAAAKMASQGASTSTALGMATLVQRENDANADFLYGEGFSAKRAAESAEAARISRMNADEYTRWAADNPEAAKAREAQAKESRRSRSSSGPAERKKDWGAYRSGQEAGDRVSIDQQAGETKVSGRLT